jgi:hypothetical protein
MSELNLHNRLPKDLPDKETIKEILLELRDTKRFNIDLRNLQLMINGVSWCANDKHHSEWVERGEVKTCELVYTSANIVNFEDSKSFFTPSVATVKETHYQIVRYPMRIDIRRSGSLDYCDEPEIIEISKDVYLRLKDYLVKDIIQEKFFAGNFIIDFMVSRYKVLI